MPDALRPLRVNALELLRQPGAEREIEVTVDAGDLDIAHPLVRGDVEVRYRLESLNDGIVVSGTASVPWSGECRRCLRSLAGVEVVPVEEFHQIELTDPDAFAIENNQLDLAPMTRESVILALDDERLCRADCQGLCPVCGVDRGQTECNCDTSVRDERWAVLDELRVDD